MRVFCLLTFLVISCLPAQAKLKVVTTTPDLAWVVQQIGGADVQTESLLRGTEDPHYVDVVPSFIYKVKKADLLCAVGLELESGWLPKVRQKAGVVGEAYCEFGRGVDVLDKPLGDIDRSMGDVHASGNPHFHLSPTHFMQGAKEALMQLQKLLPKRAAELKARYDELSRKMERLEKDIRKDFAPLQGKKFLQYHKEFSYYFQTYGLKSAGSLESVPGVSPSASRLAELALKIKRHDQEVKAVLAASHGPTSVLERFESLSGVPFVKLPLGTVEGKQESYFDLQKKLASEILKHAK